MWAEIRILAQGPTPESAELTVSLQFSFDAKSVERLKVLIPSHVPGTGELNRTWCEQDRMWYAKPAYLEAIKTFARGFDSAMLIDGNRWENLHSGMVYEQGSLF